MSIEEAAKSLKKAMKGIGNISTHTYHANLCFFIEKFEYRNR